MKKRILPVWFFAASVAMALPASGRDDERSETLQSLAGQFASPPDIYKPHAWWHWLGSNYSKEGITKDLRAMKEAGIGGVVVFNAPSWLNLQQNPWPQQTYRSAAYWDALKHTLVEAEKLNMKVGLHNSPGWSTTGGPWIAPKQGMQAVAFSVTKTAANGGAQIELPNPKGNDKAGGYYKDVAVMAVPARKDVSAGDIWDVSERFANGVLNWQVPSPGEWKIYRFGHFPTMRLSHPAPEDVADISLEADKMSPEATVKHWNGVLKPLQERFGEYIGTTFKSIWIDSYEAGEQNWSPGFRSAFIRMKGYDPVAQIILAYERGDSILNAETYGLQEVGEDFSTESKLFLKDYADVINRLYLSCWRLGKEMINAVGFQLCWEPYGSIGEAPFDMAEGAGIADMPVTEFWVHSRAVAGGEAIAKAAALYGKRIVGAEAFTGMEATCTFTETPAMLKRPADMGYVSGVNLYFLHSWAHNPLSDAFLPGWSFAHYGTHFSRNQTWFEPGKAFFTYLARCQMLLQQGTFISSNGNVLRRATPEAEIFFVRNPEGTMEKDFEFPVAGRAPELWDAYTGVIQSAARWQENGGNTSVRLQLEKDASVFVVFPAKETPYAKQSGREAQETASAGITGEWTVTFYPKTGGKPFKRKFAELVDFSTQSDEEVKYFSGTAVYEKKFTADVNTNRRVLIDLGELYDLAELEINGQKARTLWLPPYRVDISAFLQAGENTLKVSVTNTWVNRLIGDEQYPADFEWTDRNQGLRAMTGLPEWLVRGEPRPVKERKTFIPWYYFGKDSPLSPAGLLGPVTLIYSDRAVKNN